MTFIEYLLKNRTRFACKNEFEFSIDIKTQIKAHHNIVREKRSE